MTPETDTTMTVPLDEPPDEPPDGPLDGVRVLDLGGELSAYGTKILADLGADVVKVEPAGGDRQRRRPPFAAVSAGSAGSAGATGAAGLESSLTFAYYNANKRGVQLDWTGPDGQAELARLADGCDVVVISPSARQPVPGWDRDSRRLSWAGPDAVICCLTPYGLDGPLRDRRATQLTAYADSGGMASIGPAEGPPRVIPGFPFYDELSAHAAFCIMVALRERQHGESQQDVPQDGGQVIDLCLHDMLAFRESTAISYYTIAGRPVTSRQRGAAMPPTGIWDVSDGQVELLIWNPPHWEGFLDIVGRPDDLADPVLRERGERYARAEQLAPRVRELLAPFTMQGFWDLALAHRVPCAPVSTLLQVTTDPQLAGRGFWAEHDRPGTGAFRAPGRPFRSSTPLLSYRREAPLLGEHDQELLGGRWAAARAGQPRSLPGGPRLEDLRVLSFGTAIAGNVSATTLAEMGADVVKIESPDRPDPLRLPGHPGLPKAFDPSGREVSVVFSSYSRSGRALTLDMKSPAGLDTFGQLVREADVLIDNFATGVMASWGLTAQILAEMNPRLIWVSVSGYGRTGPRATAMAYGTNVNGFMGLTRVWSPHGSQFDYTAVAHVLITIVAALAHRDRTGQGSQIEIAQAEAGGVMLAPLFLEALATGEDVWPEPNEVPGSYLSGVFAAAGDDAWLAVELEDAADWDAAARLLGAPGLSTGDDSPPPAASVAEFKQVIAAWARTLTPAQGARRLQAAGLAAAAVQEVADLFTDGGIWSHDGLARLRIPGTGITTWVAGPFQRMRAPRARVRWPSPHPGQHNDEILGDWLAPGK
jgi:crotonobetainyl-CoA:carnitine CoA-transferase CaiB-like acyl-CoA transferase